MAGRKIYELSMREVLVMMAASNDRRRDEYYALLNACGSAFHGKEWKPVKPGPKTSAKRLEEREARLLERLAEKRRQRAEA